MSLHTNIKYAENGLLKKRPTKTPVFSPPPVGYLLTRVPPYFSCHLKNIKTRLYYFFLISIFAYVHTYVACMYPNLLL